MGLLLCVFPLPVVFVWGQQRLYKELAVPWDVGCHALSEIWDKGHGPGPFCLNPPAYSA